MNVNIPFNVKVSILFLYWSPPSLLRMNEVEDIRICQVVESSAVSSAAILLDTEMKESVIFARLNTLNLYRSGSDSLGSMSLPVGGRVRSLTHIRDGLALLLTFTNRGRTYIDIISCSPSLRTIMREPTIVQEGAGSARERLVVSNACGNLAAAQLFEGSIHVFRNLDTDAPRSEVFHVNRFAPVLPARSMVLVQRSDTLFALLVLYGEDDRNTNLVGFEIQVSGDKLSLERVKSLPSCLASVCKEVKPYRLFLDHRSSSLLFLGGDSSTHSAIACMSVSEAFSETVKDHHMHGPPLPDALISLSNKKGEFLVYSSFGELWSCTQNGRLKPVTSDLVPRASCMALLGQSNHLFLGSESSDSILVDVSNKEQRVLVRNSAPVIAISESVKTSPIITSVSGIGKSAALNRIKTSGIGITVSESIISLTPERLFVVGNRLLATWQDRTMAMTYSRSESDSCWIFKENIDVKYPPDLVGVYTMKNVVICVGRESVVIVSSAGTSKETWRSPSWIVDCDYCYKQDLLVIATNRELFGLTKSGTKQISLPNREVSCVAVRDNLIAVGDWSGRVELLDSNDRSIFEIVSSDRVPRDVYVGPINGDTLYTLVGYHDGTMSCARLIEGHWRVEFASIQVGTLAVRFAVNRDQVFVCGDRPSSVQIRDNQIEAVELVDRNSGTVEPMSHLSAISEDEYVFINEKGSIQSCSVGSESQCHIQRSFLSSSEDSQFASAVEMIEDQKLIAVAVSHMGTVGRDFISFCDEFSLIEKSRFELKGRVTGLCKAPRGGLAVALGTDKEGYVAICRQDALGERTVVQRTDGSVAGPVVAIAQVPDSNLIVVISGRDVCVLQVTEGDRIEHCGCVETAFMAVSLSVLKSQSPDGFRIAVGDINRSVSLYERNAEGLNRIGRDLVPACALAVELIGTDTMLMGDDCGNLYLLLLVEASLGRLERLTGCNVGESPISCIRRVGNTACWVGCKDGSVSLVSWGPELVEPRKYKQMMGSVFEVHRLSAPSVMHTMRFK